MITQERLKQILSYDSETGIFTRLRPPKTGPKVGATVTTRQDDYIVIMIDGRRYKCHNLAWLYVHGVWPARRLDHRDGDGSNNRITNLREATHQQNVRNRNLARNNTSGVHGVSWVPHLSKWKVQATIDGTPHYFGVYADIKVAARVRREVAISLFGDFAPEART